MPVHYLCGRHGERRRNELTPTNSTSPVSHTTWWLVGEQGDACVPQDVSALRLERDALRNEVGNIVEHEVH